MEDEVLKEEKRVDITGMPRGIIKFNEKLVIFMSHYIWFNGQYKWLSW